MAQGQLDLRSRNIVRALANEPDSQLRYVSSVIKVADEAVLDSLHDMGVKIINRRDELLLAFIPIHAIDRIEGLSNVSSFSVGRQSLTLMDEARLMCGATDVMQGEGLPRCYDGTGIVEFIPILICSGGTIGLSLLGSITSLLSPLTETEVEVGTSEGIHI